MKDMSRLALAAVPAALGLLAGCAGPLNNDQFLDRLARMDVPAPDTRDAEAPSAGAGAGLPAEGIELGDLLRWADTASPELRAARSRVGVASGLAWQAGLYPNPSVGVRSGEIGFEEETSNTVIGVTQPIVIGGRLRAGVSEAEAAEAARLAEVDRTRREVFGRVARLHASVLELSAGLELVDELVGIAEQTFQIAETRFEARAVAEPDVIRPRVELFRLRADRERLARELAAAERQLGLALNTDPVRAARLAGGISMTPGALDERRLAALVESGHPALVVADREVAAAGAALERVRAERVPDLDVSAGIGYSQEGDQGIAEVGVSMVVPLWDRRQGDIMSARFELMRRRQDRQAIRNRLLADLAEAMGAYDAARGQLAVFRDHVAPDAERAFGQIDESYRAGRSSFLDLLDAQRTLMESRRTVVELAGRALVARARIAAISGSHVLLNPGGVAGDSPKETTAPDGAEEQR